MRRYKTTRGARLARDPAHGPRTPTPDELWQQTKNHPQRGRAYLAELHRWGYFSYPLYNREPKE